MMRSIRFLSIACAFAVLPLLAGCEEWHSWREKRTITVETPQGTVSASSVVSVKAEIATSELAKKTAGSPVAWRIKGEAVVLEVAPGRYLFALLSQSGHTALRLFSNWDAYDPRKGPLPAGEVAAAPRNQPKELPRDHFPMLVTFTDIADPASVKRVDPDDLDASFGLCAEGRGLGDADAPWRATGLPWAEWQRFRATGLSLDEFNARKMRPDSGGLGQWQKAFAALPTARDTAADCHRLASITLEITGEPVTEGKVEQVLGWWCDFTHPYRRLSGISGPIMGNDYANQIGPGAFRIGDCQ
ncbi:MAG: hypothetical protein KDJ74_15925 [Notoacmeibacter sp.]|nr:hypothetical protein [Notoacmeibacter sp.]